MLALLLAFCVLAGETLESSGRGDWLFYCIFFFVGVGGCLGCLGYEEVDSGNTGSSIAIEIPGGWM
jgi:hypothetical protein